jgi:DNA-binding transcriptional regulator LsrR (DeoR family)
MYMPYYSRIDMPQRRITDRDEVLAAYLFAEEGMTQAGIAAELGVSPAVVSRILSRVEGKYYERKTSFLPNGIKDGLGAEIETRLLAVEISRELNRVAQFATRKPGPKVRVLRLGPNQPGEAQLSSFAKMAAPFVLQLISRTSRCGVTWGRMLANLVTAAKSIGFRGGSSAEIIPLAGEPLGFAPTSSSSSIIADELQRLLRGDDRHARTLTMLPALIPRDFTPAERRIIGKLIARLRDYQEIFIGGGSGVRPLVDGLDGLITSVGADPLGFREGSLLANPEERPFFIGDIGGVLLPKRPAGGKQAAQLRAVAGDLRDRWTGLRIEHVRRCADRATSGAPGVIVLSFGRERAPVIFECVKLGLVSYLIIDGELEQALLKECATRSEL